MFPGQIVRRDSPMLLWDWYVIMKHCPKAHHRVHKTPLLDYILGQFNRVYIFITRSILVLYCIVLCCILLEIRGTQTFHCFVKTFVGPQGYKWHSLLKSHICLLIISPYLANCCKEVDILRNIFFNKISH